MRTVWTLIVRTLREASDDEVARLGAALAYYTVFSIAPTLIIAVAVAGTLFGAEAAQGQVGRELASLVGARGAEVIEAAIAASSEPRDGIVASVAGLVTLIVGATGAFHELQQALNRVWDVRSPSGQGLWGVVRARFLSFTMVLVIGFLLSVSLALSAALSGLGAWVAAALDLPAASLQILNFVSGFALITVLFALIYKVLPDVRVAWGDVWIGAAVTALMFSVGKWLIGLYLGNSIIASTYGAAGSLAVLLVWVYYSAQILLVGAEFTQVYARLHGSWGPKAKRVALSDSLGPPTTA
jgi:membrane protein